MKQILSQRFCTRSDWWLLTLVCDLTSWKSEINFFTFLGHSKSVNVQVTVLSLIPTEYNRFNSYAVTVQSSNIYKKDKRQTDGRQANVDGFHFRCSLRRTHDSSLMGVQPEKKLFWKLVRSFFFFLRKLTVVLSSTSSSSSSLASSSTLGFLTSFRSDEAWPMSTISFRTCKHTRTGCFDVCSLPTPAQAMGDTDGKINRDDFWDLLRWGWVAIKSLHLRSLENPTNTDRKIIPTVFKFTTKLYHLGLSTTSLSNTNSVKTT